MFDLDNRNALINKFVYVCDALQGFPVFEDGGQTHNTIRKNRNSRGD